jgi:hypothetical protein
MDGAQPHRDRSHGLGTAGARRDCECHPAQASESRPMFCIEQNTFQNRPPLCSKPATRGRNRPVPPFAEKQKEKARQVFERSAEQAGFFEHGKNRLVMPAVAIHATQPVDPVVEKNGGGGNGGDDGLGEIGLDPLLVELLKKIPTSGEWPAAQRVRWFRTFAMNVSQIYDEDDKPVELKIELDKEAAN